MPKYIPLFPLSRKRLERFWANIDRSDDPDKCWLWKAGCDGSGYGRLKLASGVAVRAHRVAYYLTHGKDPADLMVCHRCDVPRCCNPDHLFLGTNSDNQRDAVAKGRKVGMDQHGTKNGNAKLSEEHIEKIKAMILAGASNKAIARVFGVTHQAISRIRRGRAWGDEPMMQPYQSLRRAG